MAELTDKLKIEHMIQMQDEMNRIINPNWAEAGYNWRTAMWMEASEMLDHIGWKWWKKQEPNILQAQLEAIDIWHFIISDSIVRDMIINMNGSSEGRLRKAINALGQPPNSSLSFSIQKFVNKVTGGADYFLEFFNICNHLGLTLDSIYETYICKNTLNIFRQNNGYKEGTYVKIWGEKEDNEVLMELFESLPKNEDLPNALYAALVKEYPKYTFKPLH